MSCNTPNSNPTNLSGLQLFYSNSSCGTNTNNCGTPTSQVVYGGPNLPCTNIETGTTLDDVLSIIDTKLCAVVGDYTLYNKACLDDVTPITTEQEFVETISTKVCTIESDLATFTGTTFVDYQTTVTNSLNDITNPELTSCSFVGVLTTDTLEQVINKITTSLCNINTNHLTLTGVNWSQCFTVSTPPTTIPQAFDLLIDQICSVKDDVGAGGALPTFNNTGSCLPTPGAADSLTDTVNKIKTRLCQTGTFDINALTWTCTTKPSTTTTDLQAAFQAVLNKLDSLSQVVPNFSGDFVVTNVDTAQPCLGKHVAFAVSN